MKSSDASLEGTGWKDVCATLQLAATTHGCRAAPFWVGLELTYPGISLGYTGVLCVNNTGEVLSPNELRRSTRALEIMRRQWPGDHQLCFFTNIEDLRRAARRSIVFGAVVDAASPAALFLAESLAEAITFDNTQTALHALTTITPLSSRRAAVRSNSLLSKHSSFDFRIQSRTTEPWLEHRDLAAMCAVQRAGIIGVDFTDVCSVFKKHRRTSNRWVSKYPRPVGAKSLGVAHGPGRVAIATRIALGGIEASLPPSEISNAIVNVSSDGRLLRLKELKTIPELIREACPDLKELVLVDDHRDQGDYLTVNIIAVRT